MSLKDYRLKTGFSQEKLASRVGVSVMTIRRWESGKTKPTSDTHKQRLQRVLGLTRAEMVEMGY